ncbi:NAD(P)H-dependent oxidoreductase [Pseudomonas gingeri]
MHALIVVAHPEPHSLSHSLAACLGEGLTSADAGHSFEIADLAAEGFDPRYSAGDLAVHRQHAAFPADVAAEHVRLERADALVLVFPVYWWSMPGLLKGWIDRVFANGWAFDFSLDGPFVKKLGRLQVHLVGVGGADPQTFERHGYAHAMKTQIDHGIFDYCGATVVTSSLLLNSESDDPQAHLDTARAIGRGLFAGANRPDLTEMAICG